MEAAAGKGLKERSDGSSAPQCHAHDMYSNRWRRLNEDVAGIPHWALLTVRYYFLLESGFVCP